MIKYIHSISISGEIDVAVSDNGRRKENYDGLNWGIVWLSGSKNRYFLSAAAINITLTAQLSFLCLQFTIA